MPKEHDAWPTRTAIITNNTTLMFDLLFQSGGRGITTRDAPGYDLRHYLRVMRNKGIGVIREWEANADGGQHGRWRLTRGHTYRDISRRKEKPAGQGRALSPNSTGEVKGGWDATNI